MATNISCDKRMFRHVVVEDKKYYLAEDVEMALADLKNEIRGLEESLTIERERTDFYQEQAYGSL